MNNKLLIGWSEADITPVTDKKIGLYGQYYVRLAEKIHSNLKVTAAAFSSGNDHFLTAGLDNAGLPLAFYKNVCNRVAELEKEIDTTKIFLHAIHTHSAPCLNPEAGPIGSDEILHCKESLREEDRVDYNDIITPAEYSAFACEKVAQALVEAWHNRKEGGIGRAFGNARIGHCRRAVFSDNTAEMYGDTTRRDYVGMEAGEDSGVDMLFTFDKEGKKTGLILNVACPSQVMESTYSLSSDFAGATREKLQKEFGSDFRMIYEISPAGCQSPRDLVRHYVTEPDFWHADGVEELSNRLVCSVTTAKVEKIDYEPVFKSEQKIVSLPRRRASYQDYIKAKAELERLTSIMHEKEAFIAFCDETHANERLDGHGPYDDKKHHFSLIKIEKAVLARYENQDETPFLTFPMNVIRMGDIAIATNPFELYLYFGQIIKARSKATQTFLVQLCNGASIHAGYLPSPDGEKFGGYGGLIVNGQVGSDGGYKLCDDTVEAINKMFED